MSGGMETTNLTQDTLARIFAQGKRFDGRKMFETREFSVSGEVSNKAEGSARVKLGKTDVAVGIKLELGTPYNDSPDKGNLMVSGDLLPLASPRFEAGPPKFNAIELPRLIDRMVRESHMIDLKKLVVTPGEKVWTVIIDIYPINDDGSLIDAASIAVLYALMNAKLPKIGENGKIDYDQESTEKLPLNEGVLPLSFTFYKLGESLLVDPNREEEEACESKIVFGLSMNNKEHMIHSCQKGLMTPFSKQEISKMMEELPKLYDDTLKKLKKFIK